MRDIFANKCYVANTAVPPRDFVDSWGVEECVCFSLSAFVVCVLVYACMRDH